MRELVAGGARAAASPREVGERSDVIGICVPADDHVRAVVYGDDGLLAGTKPGAVIAIHSTILPATAIEIAEAARPLGVAVLDACVTGGAERAKQKQITYIVGGDADGAREGAARAREQLGEDHPRGCARQRRQAQALHEPDHLHPVGRRVRVVLAREGDRPAARRCSRRPGRRTASSRS